VLRQAVGRIESRLVGPTGAALCRALNFNDVGLPWLIFDCTANPRCAALGRKVFDRLAAGDGWNAPGENNGFRLYYAGVLGYKLTGEPRFLDEVLRGLERTAAIYDPSAGVFHSNAWIEGTHSTLIDTGATLNAFLWASAQRPEYRAMLDSHYRRILREHVRPDGSTIQMVLLDPATGRRIGHRTYQGYSDDSCWARGQAWGIYGYAAAYEALGEPLFLDTARRLADWYVERVPPDGVPYYDFLDPHAPDAPPDTSAAALACAGILRLARCWPQMPTQYMATARTAMRTLATDYLTAEGRLLGGCWGRFPDEFLEGKDWIHRENRHANEYYVWGRNIVLPESGELFYALGFFVESLHRLLKPDSDLLDL
jgi:unsaturated chondroitin disaccharide hydrolase